MFCNPALARLSHYQFNLCVVQKQYLLPKCCYYGTTNQIPTSAPISFPLWVAKTTTTVSRVLHSLLAGSFVGWVVSLPQELN